MARAVTLRLREPYLHRMKVKDTRQAEIVLEAWNTNNREVRLTLELDEADARQLLEAIAEGLASSTRGLEPLLPHQRPREGQGDRRMSNNPDTPAPAPATSYELAAAIDRLRAEGFEVRESSFDQAEDHVHDEKLKKAKTVDRATFSITLTRESDWFDTP